MKSPLPIVLPSCPSSLRLTITGRGFSIHPFSFSLAIDFGFEAAESAFKIEDAAGRITSHACAIKRGPEAMR